MPETARSLPNISRSVRGWLRFEKQKTEASGRDPNQEYAETFCKVYARRVIGRTNRERRRGDGDGHAQKEEEPKFH
jgi:hypothetical protein